MNGRQIAQHGAWQVATVPSAAGGFLGWAKAGEIVGADPIDEPGEPVFFNWGATRDEVAGKLLAEVGASH